MEIVDRKSNLWNYLSDELRGLILDGEKLLTNEENSPTNVSDYSYLVFPFSKAYEGFLKKLFLDLKLIEEDDYYGEYIRIGRILDPFYDNEDKSAYKKLLKHDRGGYDITERLWAIWRMGRNRVFHYFPHNFRKLSFEDALEIITEILGAMEEAVLKCHPKSKGS